MPGLKSFSRLVPTNTEEQVGFLKLDPIDVNGKTYILISDNYVKAFDNRENV
jgi:hypothetical protein